MNFKRDFLNEAKESYCLMEIQPKIIIKKEKCFSYRDAVYDLYGFLENKHFFLLIFLFNFLISNRFKN